MTQETSTEKGLRLLRQFLDLGPSYRAAMVRSLRPTADEAFVDELSRMCDEYESILSEIPAGARIPDADMIRQQLADALNWRGLAKRKTGNLESAIEDYEKAERFFVQLGRAEMAAKTRESIAQLRTDEEGNVDDEIVRLRAELDRLKPGTFLYLRTQILLGELYTQNGDDHEARKYLLPAEASLLAINPNPTEADILGNLFKSIANIESAPTSSSQMMPVVSAMEVRALYQRLYFALARSHRQSNPGKSAEYEEKLREFTKGKQALTQEQLEQIVSGKLSVADLNLRKK